MASGARGWLARDTVHVESALIDAVVGAAAKVEALLQKRADPDVRDSRGLAALHLACARGQAAALDLLIKASADVEVVSRDAWRMRPRHVAARFAASGVGAGGVRALLAAAANPEATRADGQTARQLATPGSRIHRELAAAEGRWAAATGPRPQRPALVYVAKAGRRERLYELLKLRTDPNSVDESGATALHVACLRGDDAMVGALLQAGASANRAVRDRLGARPLHCAAQTASQRCVQLLLAAHAKPALPDRTRPWWSDVPNTRWRRDH